jgi:membrane protease YdiL (CAAX protease family)
MFDEDYIPPEPAKLATPTLKDILLVCLFSALLLLTLGSLLQNQNLLLGLTATELFFLLGPPLLYTLGYHYNLKRTFQLAPIPFKTVWLTLIIMLSAFVLIGVVAILQELVLPRSQNYLENWNQVLQKFRQAPFGLTFFVVGVLPGICEELFFRGFLLGGFRQKYPAGTAIIIAGVLFGVFHFDPYRFLPVTLLGILFGYLVVTTGSILPGMLAHTTNNTLSLVLSAAALKYQGQSPVEMAQQEILSVQTLLTLVPIVLLALFIFISALRALPRSRPASPEPPSRPEI